MDDNPRYLYQPPLDADPARPATPPEAQVESFSWAAATAGQQGAAIVIGGLLGIYGRVRGDRPLGPALLTSRHAVRQPALGPTAQASGPGRPSGWRQRSTRSTLSNCATARSPCSPTTTTSSSADTQ